MISSVTVNHQNSSLKEIEKASKQSPEEAEKQLLSISGVTEAYVLQTCHRAEAYINTKNKQTAKTALNQYTENGRTRKETRTIHDILYTAAGLNSVITGEDEILGQIKKRYEKARNQKHIDNKLEKIIEKAVQTGKKVRSQTSINEGTITTASMAVKLTQGYKPINKRKIMIIGAGEIAQNTAQALDNQVDALTIANRTPENIDKIDKKTDAKIRKKDLNNIEKQLEIHNTVITATGSNKPILHPHHLQNKGELHIIDLAQPRDIHKDASKLKNVKINDLETVKKLIENSKQERKKERTEALNIVLENRQQLQTQLSKTQNEETIQSIMADANQTREKQLEKAYKELENGTPPREVMEKLSTSLTHKILEQPIKSIRNGDEKHIKLAEQLYNIEK